MEPDQSIAASSSADSHSIPSSSALDHSSTSSPRRPLLSQDRTSKGSLELSSSHKDHIRNSADDTLTPAERKELVRRNTKLSKLLGDDAIADFAKTGKHHHHQPWPRRQGSSSNHELLRANEASQSTISVKAATRLGLAPPCSMAALESGSGMSEHQAVAPPLSPVSTVSARRSLDSLCSFDETRNTRQVSAARPLSMHSYLSDLDTVDTQSADVGSSASLTLREERRRRAAKMSRWLGDVIPAHIAAPDENDAAPAYTSDDVVGAQQRHRRTESGTPFWGKGAPGTPSRLIPRRAFSKHQRGDSSGNGNSRSSTPMRESQSLDGHGASSAAGGGSSVAMLASPSMLTPHEHYERVKRINKLEHLLGEGSGSAALRSVSLTSRSNSRERLVSKAAAPSSSVDQTHQAPLGGTADLEITQETLQDLLESADADEIRDIVANVQLSGDDEKPSDAKRHDSAESEKAEKEASNASHGIIDYDNAPQGDDKLDHALHAQHRKRAAQAQKLGRFFGTRPSEVGWETRMATSTGSGTGGGTGGGAMAQDAKEQTSHQG